MYLGFEKKNYKMRSLTILLYKFMFYPKKIKSKRKFSCNVQEIWTCSELILIYKIRRIKLILFKLEKGTCVIIMRINFIIISSINRH